MSKYGRVKSISWPRRLFLFDHDELVERSRFQNRGVESNFDASILKSTLRVEFRLEIDAWKNLSRGAKPEHLAPNCTTEANQSTKTDENTAFRKYDQKWKVGPHLQIWES